MPEPKILVSPPREAAASYHAPAIDQAWKWVGVFSLVLTAAGTGDWLLAWIPPNFGSVEWEFGTIVSSISNLPLVTMGFAGLLASAVARAIRWQIVAVSCALLLLALALLIALTFFALDIPVALAAVGQSPARIGIIKAILKTLFLGPLFAGTYLVAAILALRKRS